jgi:hypothetical protein
MEMNAKERDALDVLLFGTDGTELLDFKCFRGDRPDVSEDEIRDQIHSAIMQKRMKRATISADPPRPDVPRTNVREFVQDLQKPA